MKSIILYIFSTFNINTINDRITMFFDYHPDYQDSEIIKEQMKSLSDIQLHELLLELGVFYIILQKSILYDIQNSVDVIVDKVINDKNVERPEIENVIKKMEEMALITEPLIKGFPNYWEMFREIYDNADELEKKLNKPPKLLNLDKLQQSKLYPKGELKFLLSPRHSKKKINNQAPLIPDRKKDTDDIEIIKYYNLKRKISQYFIENYKPNYISHKYIQYYQNKDEIFYTILKYSINNKLIKKIPDYIKIKQKKASSPTTVTSLSSKKVNVYNIIYFSLKIMNLIEEDELFKVEQSQVVLI